MNAELVMVLRTHRDERAITLFTEDVGDILEENQARHHVLVFGGIHVRAEGIGGSL